jgi:molybdopterin molybdotransferase
MGTDLMIPVAEAQARLLALAAPLPPQIVSLEHAIGRYLAEDVIAKRDQPAADLSAMDGYAIRFTDLPGPFSVIGESAAGAPFASTITDNQTVRIFTGAHVPAGADTILVQEDVRANGTQIFVGGDGPNVIGKHIRRQGGDFRNRDVLLHRGVRVQAGAVAAAAMAGYGSLSVGGIPNIKILGTGDELMPPGDACDAAHVPSSNNIMLRAMLNSLPCNVVDAGIVRDDLQRLIAAFDDAADFDIIVTSGGASVGDRDFVQDALKAAGAEIAFWRVSMRPGKPLMAARIGTTIVLGLPGNPTSAFVTAFLFLLPLVRHLAGSNAPYPDEGLATVTVDAPIGDNRTEYQRAHLENGQIKPFVKQDSGMITPLIEANALLVRPAYSPPLIAGGLAQYLAL